METQAAREVIDVVPEPQVDELKTLWQEYLQKCCEVGQIQHQLEQLDSQKREIEKHLEVTQQAVKRVAQKHREAQKANMEKVKVEAIEKAKETIQ